MKTKRYIVSTSKAFLSGITLLFFWGYAGYYLCNSLWPEFIVFATLGGVFCRQFIANAAYIELTDQSVSMKFLGYPRRSMLWSDIQEVGIIGENVFSRKKRGKRKSGDKFIYFSPERMNRDSRFQMIVNWPPKKCLYIEYTPEALEHVQLIWNRPVKYYNAEDLNPDTND